MPRKLIRASVARSPNVAIIELAQTITIPRTLPLDAIKNGAGLVAEWTGIRIVTQCACEIICRRRRLASRIQYTGRIGGGLDVCERRQRFGAPDVW